MIRMNELDGSKQLEGLLEVAGALTSNKSHQDILGVLVSVIAKVLDVVRCSVILVDPNQPTGRVVAATYEQPSPGVPSIQLSKYPEIAEAVASGQAVFVEDVHHDARMTGVASNLTHLDIHSILVIPITHRDPTLGASYLRTSRPRRSFTPQEILFCHTAARMAANALLGLTQYQRVVQDNEDLTNRAPYDPLTGLLNQGSLLAHLEQAFAIAGRHKRSLSYLVIDLDDFKNFRDAYGQEESEQGLQCVANAIRITLRKSDIAAREGVDRFALLLPETDAAGAMVEAERIRRTVREIRVGDDGALSVSIGVATFPSPTIQSKEDLMRQADHALSVAKASGKNRSISLTTATAHHEKA